MALREIGQEQGRVLRIRIPFSVIAARHGKIVRRRQNRGVEADFVLADLAIFGMQLRFRDLQEATVWEIPLGVRTVGDLECRDVRDKPFLG
jgi:hypothetical protein